MKKHLIWIENTSNHFPEVQEKIESDCELIIRTYLQDQNDYVIEKFLKMYTESFVYLEKLLMKSRGLDFSCPEAIQALTPDNLYRKQEEVKEILLDEARRQYRHAGIIIRGLTQSSALESEKQNVLNLERAINVALDEETAKEVFALYNNYRHAFS